MKEGSKKTILCVIAAIVIAGGSFYGGTVYQKSLSGGVTAGGAANFRNNANRQGGGNAAGGSFGQGGNLAGGQAGAGRLGGNMQIGQIISSDAQSLTIQLLTGGSKIIFFNPSTPITKDIAGSKDDLKNGTNVMVQATANPDGSATAQSIQIRPLPTAPATAAAVPVTK